MTVNSVLGVQVPASSANLGPGFDAFAVAVNLRLQVRVLDRGPCLVTVEGEGSAELPDDETNLVWRALERFCRHAGVGTPDVSLHAHSSIPLERGLGSSAAAAVAGVALGRALTEASADDQDLIDLATDLEGHADNAAAALLGGLVVCCNGRARRLEPTDDLVPVVCVPDHRQSTSAARGLLPATVTLADAAANGARAAVVLAGLCGAMAWDAHAMTDVLHEPARLEAMPQSGALVHRLRDSGLAACLSGAGPSVLVVAPVGDEGALRRISDTASGWRVLPAAWDRAGAVIERAPVGR